MKELQGYGDKDWAEWFNHLAKNAPIESSSNDRIRSGTVSELAPLWMENFIINLPNIIDRETYPETKEQASIGTLPKHKGQPAIIIGAGPSLEEHNHLEMLAESNFKGALFLTDRILIPALKKGVTPEKFSNFYVCSVDGNREKIVKWFDDPILDDYGPKITALFATTGAPNAINRCVKAKAKIKFFHGMLDQFSELDSITSFMNHMTKSTAVNCLGNTGGACWTIAYYLQCAPEILIGVDYGYPTSTPIEDTAYYEAYIKAKISPEVIQTLYTTGHNPLFGTDYKIDLVYQYYKESFLHAMEMADVITINCTEGGTLHGGKLLGMKFETFLKQIGAT